MSGILETDCGTFLNQQRTVGIGSTYAAYEGDDVSVSIGDMVFFRDPDAGIHARQCELVMSDEFIGYVDTVYAHDCSWDDDDPTVNVGMDGAPLGRLDPTDRYVTVVRTEGGIGERGHPTDEVYGSNARVAKGMAETLHNSDEWDKWFHRESHGGRSAVPDETFEALNTCADCDQPYGPTHVEGA